LSAFRFPFFLSRRSPDEAQRNPGISIQAAMPFPDFAALHPGYGLLLLA
jgi:hypothetical protein